MIPACEVTPLLPATFSGDRAWEDLFSTTLDCTPQIKQLRETGAIPLPNTEARGCRCVLFECTEDDEPLALAQQVVLQPYVDEQRRPLDSRVHLEPLQIQVQGVGKRPFIQALCKAKPDFPGWLAGPARLKAVFVEVAPGLGARARLLGIQAAVEELANRNAGACLVVFVACRVDTGASGLLGRLRRRWDQSRLPSTIVRLPPLAPLQPEDLSAWYSALPYAFTRDYQSEEIHKGLDALEPKCNTLNYRELRTKVARLLAIHRRWSPNPSNQEPSR